MNLNPLTGTLRVPKLCFAWLLAAQPLLGAALSPKNNQQDTLLILVNQHHEHGRGYSLRSAVAEANSYPGVTEIRFDTGVFKKNDTLVLEKGPLRIESFTRLILRTPGAEYLRLSGNNRHALFTVAPQAYLKLHGLVLCQGVTDGEHYGLPGGAIYNEGTLVMDHCLVTNNTAEGWLGTGGGICNDGGGVLLEACRLLDNTVRGVGHATAGGGLYSKDGTVVIRNCIVADNRATGGIANHGAGIYCEGGVLKIGNTLISENILSAGQDSNYGGGLFLNNVEAQLTACTIAGNEMEGSVENYGAGIYNRGSLQLQHCVLKENRIGEGFRNRGGALYHSEGRVELTHCSLVANEVDFGKQENLGGGIFGFGGEIRAADLCLNRNEAAGKASGVDGRLIPLVNEISVTPGEGSSRIHRGFATRKKVWFLYGD